MKRLLLVVMGLLMASSFILAAGKVAKNATTIQRDPDGYPIQTVSFTTIRQLLVSRKYAKLNILLDGYQKEFNQDFRNEYKLFDAYRTFEAPVSGYHSLFDEWVRKYPNAYQSHLAKAFYLEKMGWESRGYKWADETKSGQFEMMERYFSASKQELETAFRLNPKAIEGYNILISMNTATSDDNENEALINKALELFPYSFMLRSTYLNALEPRWSGSYSEMDSFANAAQNYVKINPRLVLLQGFSLADRADTAMLNEDYTKAVNLYNKVLSFGDFWRHYYGLAECYYYGNKEAEALPYINKAILLCPQDEDCYLLRAKINYRLGYYDQLIKDIQTAEAILPGYSETKETEQWLSQNFVTQGFEQQKSQRYDQAVILYTKAIMIKPDNPDAYYWRGQTYCYQKQLQLAYNDFNQAITLNPKYFDAYLAIDWVLCHSQQWDRIIAYWNKYIALAPNDGRAYRERGGTYYHKGDLKAALADAKKAGELGDAEGERQYERLLKMVK